jgi:hypothetical protein
MAAGPTSREAAPYLCNDCVKEVRPGDVIVVLPGSGITAAAPTSEASWGIPAAIAAIDEQSPAENLSHYFS